MILGKEGMTANSLDKAIITLISKQQESLKKIFQINLTDKQRWKTYSEI